MNAPKMLQMKRAVEIERIKASIETTLCLGKTIDYDTLIMSTASELNLSMRTAKEYVAISLHQLKLTPNDLGSQAIADASKKDYEDKIIGLIKPTLADL